jgi:type IV pilus assembly protein PilE
MHPIYRRNEEGFTIIELMIVVAIVGILSAIAYPSYREHVFSARRSDAHQSLLNAVNRQEQYFLDHNTYGSATAAGISGTSSEGYYNITVATTGCGSTPCYLITATATGAQAGDTDCNTLTIQSDGYKGFPASGSLAECW